MNFQTPLNDQYNIDNIMDTDGIVLSEHEKDALGEIGNICMGTSATTLSTLLGKRVTITTPRVYISRGNEYLDEYEKPVVLTEVSYTQGLDGSNTFLLKKDDALLITSLLMGGDGSGGNAEELEEYYLSAIGEVMNQMVGSSSTALATALQVHVNIAPPMVRELTEDEKNEKRNSDEVSIVISFRMEIEDLLVSNIMQIMPLGFGKKLVTSLSEEDSGTEDNAPESIEPSIEPENPEKEINKESAVTGMESSAVRETKSNDKNVELKSVQFQTFDDAISSVNMASGNNIDRIIDVPLQVTVVLGKSKKNIKEILELGMGSVIVLDRLAGEMVDVLVNGKMFARGEVVVINDNYGVRITEMSESQGKQ